MSTSVTQLETLRGLGVIERQPMECPWTEKGFDFLLPSSRSPLAKYWLLIELVNLFAVLSRTMGEKKTHVLMSSADCWETTENVTNDGARVSPRPSVLPNQNR